MGSPPQLYSKKARGFHASQVAKREMIAVSRTCAAASLLFFINAVLRLAAHYRENEGHLSMPLIDERLEQYTSLNVTLLHRIWRDRAAARPMYLVGDLFGALAWFAVLPGIMSLAKVVGGDKASASKIMSSAFTVAAVLTVIDFTFAAGTVSVTDWISTWPIMANDGLSANASMPPMLPTNGSSAPPGSGASAGEHAAAAAHSMAAQHNEAMAAMGPHFSPLQALEISWQVKRARPHS